jgi:quercetin dioxygenase-like cupin family protein
LFLLQNQGRWPFAAGFYFSSLFSKYSSKKKKEMPVLKYDEAQPEQVGPGLVRRQVHTANLMMVVVDFTNGPQNEPDPAHQHPHEQTCYVAAGEVMFFLEGEEPQHLKPGDMFYVPPMKPHCIQLLTREVRLVDSFNPIRADFL